MPPLIQADVDRLNAQYRLGDAMVFLDSEREKLGITKIYILRRYIEYEYAAVQFLRLSRSENDMRLCVIWLAFLGYPLGNSVH